MTVGKGTKSQYVGLVVGCAVGDALGMPIEAWKPEQIKKYVPGGVVDRFFDPIIVKDGLGKVIAKDEYGRLPSYNKTAKKGEYTDDTIRHIPLTESIIAVPSLDLLDVAERQLAAYKAMKLPDGTIKGGFGKTTMQGLENLRLGMPPMLSGVVGGPGNAPGMMMHSLGAHLDAFGYSEKVLYFAEDVGRITHLDPRSLAAGVVQAHAIYVALQHGTREDFVSSIADVCKQWEKPVTEKFSLFTEGSLTTRLEWVRDHADVSTEDAYATLGNTSDVFKSYPFALFMFQKYWNDPVQGLIATVNYGGDCDTTGAIFGALAGARHGYFFPRGWTEELQNRMHLISLGEQLFALKQGEPS